MERGDPRAPELLGSRVAAVPGDDHLGGIIQEAIQREEVGAREQPAVPLGLRCKRSKDGLLRLSVLFLPRDSVEFPEREGGDGVRRGSR